MTKLGDGKKRERRWRFEKDNEEEEAQKEEDMTSQLCERKVSTLLACAVTSEASCEQTSPLLSSDRWDSLAFEDEDEDEDYNLPAIGLFKKNTNR